MPEANAESAKAPTAAAARAAAAPAPAAAPASATATSAQGGAPSATPTAPGAAAAAAADKSGGGGGAAAAPADPSLASSMPKALQERLSAPHTGGGAHHEPCKVRNCRSRGRRRFPGADSHRLRVGRTWTRAHALVPRGPPATDAAKRRPPRTPLRSTASKCTRATCTAPAPKPPSSCVSSAAPPPAVSTPDPRARPMVRQRRQHEAWP